MGDRELSEEMAMQTYETCLIVQNHSKRITTLEKRDKKTYGYTGGLGAFFGAVIVVIVEFFRRG
jgi:hypothetical protein